MIVLADRCGRKLVRLPVSLGFPEENRIFGAVEKRENMFYTTIGCEHYHKNDPSMKASARYSQSRQIRVETSHLTSVRKASAA